MQSLKNFFIAFGVGLIIFGIFAFAAVSIMGNDSKEQDDGNTNTEDVENVFASGDPDNPEIALTGDTFTAVIGGYDKSGKELDALIFIKADRDNMRFVISSIPTNLKAPITTASVLPEEGSENVNLNDDVDYTKTYVRIKDVPSKFPGEANQMIMDITTLITGMPVDYYAFVDYDSVVAIFKQTSGLHYNVPKDMVYIGTGTEEAPEFTLKKGEQILDAAQAIALMRYADDTANERTNYNERASRQADFLASAMIQVLKRDPEELFSGLDTILKECETNFTVDDFKENFELISKFSEYSGNNVTVSFDNYSSEFLSYEEVSRRFSYYR